MSGAATVGRLIIDMAADTAQLRSDVATGVQIMEGGVQKIQDAANAAKTALIGLAAAFAPAAILAMLESTIAATAALAKMSESTGASVEALSALRSAANIVGTDFAVVTQGIGKLDKAMYEAATTGGKTAAVFKALGVEYLDNAGQLRNVDDVMLDTAKAFAGMESSALKTADAQILFGKAGKDLIPTLNEIGQIGEYVAKVTGDQAAVAKDLEENWNRLGATGKAIKQIFANELAPALDALVKTFIGVQTESGGLLDAVKDLREQGALERWAFNTGLELAKLGDALIDTKNFVVALGETIAALGVGAKATFDVLIGGTRFMTGDLKAGLAQFLQGTQAAVTAWDALKTTWGDLTWSTKLQTEYRANYVAVDAITKATRDNKGALEDAGAAAKSYALNISSITSELEKLGKEGASLDAQIESLQKYGQVTKETELAVAQYEVTSGKLSVTLDAVSLLFPQLADAMRLEILQTAASNDQKKIQIAVLTEAAASYKKYIDALAGGLTHLQNQLQAEKDRTAQFGLTKLQVMDLTIAEQQRKIEFMSTAEASDIETAAEERRLVLLQQIRAQYGKQEELQQWSSVLASVATAGANFLVDFVEHGASAFKNLWQNFKKWALEALAEIAAKQILVSIGGAVTGTGSAASQAASGIAGSSGSSIITSAAGKILSPVYDAAGKYAAGAAYQYIGGAGAEQAAVLAAQTAGFGVEGTAATLSALNTAGAAGGAAGAGIAEGAAVAGAGEVAGAVAGEAVLAAIPVVGWIALAAIAAYAIFGNKGGGPMSKGNSSSGDIGNFSFDGGIGIKDNNALGDLTGSAAKQAQTSYQAWLKALGGTGSAAFAIGASSDPQGDAQSNARAAAIVGGKTVFESADVQAAGRTSESLAAALALEADKAILAALQASALPDVVSSYLKSIDVSTATLKQITDALNHAKDLKVLVDQVSALPKSLADGLLAAMLKAPQLDDQIRAFATEFAAFGVAAGKLNDVLARDPTAEALTALAGAHTAALDKVIALRGGLATLIDGFDGSSASVNALSKATGDYVTAQAAALGELLSLKAGLEDMFSGSIKQLDWAVLNTAQRGDFLKNEATKTLELLKTTTDPTNIQKFAQLINKDLVDAFNLLSPEQQKIQHDAFVAQLQGVNDATITQINKSEAVITQGGEGQVSILSSVRDAVNRAADKQLEAAEKLIAAADKISAAGTGIQAGAAVIVSGAATFQTAANTPLVIDPIIISVGARSDGDGP